MARGDGPASTYGAEEKPEEGEQWQVVLATATVAWVTASGVQPAGMSPEDKEPNSSSNSEAAATAGHQPCPKPKTLARNLTQIEPISPNCGSLAWNRGLAKKASRKERSDAPTSKSLNKLANQGDSNEPGSVGIPRGRKDKPRNAHKKRKDQRVPNDKSKSSQEVEEATMEDIYQISSGEEDCSQGMKKWIKEYHDRRPGLKVLQQRIDDFIASHEEQEEQAKKEREAKMTEEGWTVVVHHKGGKKTTDRESGVAVGSVAEAAVRDKLAKKKSKDVGLDFYRFQKKEAQRSEIMKLQSKFEEDKKRIQQLRAARKFRPY